MASTESNILKRIMLALSGDVVLWRNNRGIAKQGTRTIRFGVGPNGASDLIGYRSMTVTPEMVGQKVAIFTAIEVKKPGGKIALDQIRYVETVKAAGGLACVADSVDVAKKAVADAK